MGRKIKDNRLMKLLRGLLDAGYFEAWTYHQTYSGVSQGGVLSPLLMKILLNELDDYIEQTLIPKYTRGKARQRNPEYQQIQSRIQYAKRTQICQAVQYLHQQRWLLKEHFKPS